MGQREFVCPAQAHAEAVTGQKRQKNLRQNPYRYQSAETVVEGVLSVPAAVVYGIMTVFGGVNP